MPETGGKSMKEIQIDKTKLEEAMKMIEKAAFLMEERDCRQEPEAREELARLQNDLGVLTRNDRLQITNFRDTGAAPAWKP